MRKTLIINDWAPPVIQGGAILLEKIFRLFPVGSYSILMKEIDYSESAVDPSRKLDCHYYYFKMPRYKGKNKILILLSFFMDFSLLIHKGIQVVIKEKVSNIFAPVNQGAIIFAAYLVSKLSGRKFYVYVHDILEELPRSRIERYIIRVMEKRILKSAEKIFVVCEFLDDHYSKKYGLKTELTPNPVDLDEYKKTIPENLNNELIKIVYTGMIYWAQLDPIQNLVKAINSFKDGKIKLYIYSPHKRDYLIELGIFGKNVVIDQATKEEIPSIQKAADFLFLPMTFNLPYPLLTKTAATTKLPEYLAAGRPIIVHAPADSYLSYHAKKNNSGLVIDRLDSKFLKRSILKLIEDKKLQETLSQNAYKTSLNHHVVKVSRIVKDHLL